MVESLKEVQVSSEFLKTVVDPKKGWWVSNKVLGLKGDCGSNRRNCCRAGLS